MKSHHKTQYIQNKSAYIKLTNNSDNIQFILFGDVMTGHKCWFYDLDGNKVDFVDKLKK